jgi:hypothetical protein
MTFHLIIIIFFNFKNCLKIIKCPKNCIILIKFKGEFVNYVILNKIYIVRNYSLRMQSFIEPKKNLDNFDSLCKSAFLSYYISIYVTNIDTRDKSKGVSVNEIYDFLQDLQNDLHIIMPKINKRDISLCFYILNKLGICNCLK